MCITSNINRDIENDTCEIVLRTYSLGLTYMTRNDGYGALISHTFFKYKIIENDEGYIKYMGFLLL